MKTRNFLMIATSCLAVMAGSALSAQTRSFVVAEVNDVTTFDPHQATDNTTISINDHIFEGLVALVEDGSFQPRLAESWTVSEDQLTWTFKLRQGVKFSDGAELNAAAVKASIERIVDPAFGPPGRARLNLPESTEVVDDDTVAFKTKVPWPALMDGLAGNSTRILSPKVPGSETDVNKTPIGTGPFVLESSQPNQGTTLVVNPGYWGEAPKLDKITITTVPDAAVRATLLQAGEIDVALKVNPENVATLEADPAITVTKSPSTFPVFYMFNMREKPFDDPRVRKALNMAIDREAIVGSLLQGAGIVQRSIFPGSVPHRVELPAIEYNPQAAKALLAEAGYPDGLEVTLWTSPRYQKDRQTAEAVQAYLRQNGVKMTVDMADWGTHWQRINAREGKAGMYLLATTISEAPYRLEWNFGRKASGYWGGYGNEEFWNLLDEAGQTLDTKIAAGNFAKLQEMVWNDNPYMFLYDRILINAKDKNLDNFWINGREIRSALRAEFKE